MSVTKMHSKSASLRGDPNQVIHGSWVAPEWEPTSSETARQWRNA